MVVLLEVVLVLEIIRKDYCIQWGADIVHLGEGDVQINKAVLKAIDVVVPNDVSSAAFFVVAGLLLKDSTIVMRNIGLNPTRSGLLTVLQQMGGNIEIVENRLMGGGNRLVILWCVLLNFMARR